MKRPLRTIRILPIVALLAAVPFLLLACERPGAGAPDGPPENATPADAEEDEEPTPTPEEQGGDTPGVGNGVDADESETIAANLRANGGNFSTLLQALDVAGLDVMLDQEGPYTLFAPSDAAFGELSQERLAGLLADTTVLGNMLRYHIVEGELTTDTLEDGQELEMDNGETLSVSSDGDTVMIGDATIDSANLEASNGVIHVIDSVLLPAE